MVGMANPALLGRIANRHLSRKQVALVGAAGMLLSLSFLGSKPSSRPVPAPTVQYETIEVWDRGSLAGRALVVPKGMDTEAQLMILAHQLEAETPDKSLVVVRVFNDEAAARLHRTIVSTAESDQDRAAYEAHFIAQYLRNRTNGLHQLRVHLNGPNGPNQRTIDL